MIRYAKITLDDGTRFILRITDESAVFVRGIEVDAHGDEVVPRGAHNRLRIVDRGRIAKMVPMRMSPTYAILEPAPKTPEQLDAEVAEFLTKRTAP